MAVRTPRDYQRDLRDFALDHERVNWWAGTGTGKTASAIETFDHLRLFGEAERLLVISTKRVASMVWTNELAKWENFAHLSIATAIGTPAQRLAAVRARADITTINYDNLPWLIETMGDAWPWDMVIPDESTKIKSLRVDMRVGRKSGQEFLRKSGGGERAMQLARVAHKKVRRWINMTGTPSPNGLIDVWGQQWYVDAGARLGRSFSAFQARWFRSIKVKGDNYKTILEPWPHADAEIKRLMADCTLTIEAKDYFDLPPLVKNIIPIKLPPKAYQHYREMEQAMFTEIRHNEIEAFNSGAKSMKCRQLASGAAYIESDDGRDTKPWVVVHDEKLDVLEDIVIEAAGAPILVAYQFKSDLARLKQRFPQGVYFDDSPATLARFRRGEIPLLFLHPASAAHGIDGMQDACNIVVWFSMTWNLEEFEQLVERIGPTRQVQAGLHRTVYCHMLVAEHTVEEEMVERIDTKATVQDSLRQAMKRRSK
jgi:SNF2 family DNA or RNA helicase